MKTRFSAAWAAPSTMSATAAAHAEASTIRKAVWVTCAIVVSTCGPRGPHVRQAQHAADPCNYQRADVATELNNSVGLWTLADPSAVVCRYGCADHSRATRLGGRRRGFRAR